jgi:NADPH:quinone reductase
LTRPSLGNYIATAAELQQRAGAVFGMIRDGKLKLRIEHVYPLAEAQQAHRDLGRAEDYGEVAAVAVRGLGVSSQVSGKTGAATADLPGFS